MPGGRGGISSFVSLATLISVGLVKASGGTDTPPPENATRPPEVPIRCRIAGAPVAELEYSSSRRIVAMKKVVEKQRACLSILLDFDGSHMSASQSCAAR